MPDNVTTMLKKTTDKIGTSPTLTSMGAAAGAIMAIMTLLTYLHIDVIPFAWASDLDQVQRSIDKLTEAVTQQNRTVLQIQRDSYKSQLDEAEEELKKNLESKAAKKEVERLRAIIADLERQIAALEK